MCTELLQKTACEKLLLFMIYKVTYRHKIDKNKKTAVIATDMHVYKSSQKNGTSNGENSGEFFLGIPIYFAIHL